MKFISESQIIDNNCLFEDKDEKGEKIYFIEGIFMQAEKKNRNGRVYPKEVLFEAVDKLREEIPNGLLGEMYHPTEGGHEINWKNACMKVISLKEDGNNIIGKAKVSKNLALGGILIGLIEEGVQIGVSSRGFGELKESGGSKVVQPGFFLKTIDAVTTPSCQDAIMTAVMESKEWVFENGVLVEKDLKKIVEDCTKKKLSKTKAFQKIVNEIAKSAVKK